jgi:hypothetical protein
VFEGAKIFHALERAATVIDERLHLPGGNLQLVKDNLASINTNR